MKSHIVPVLLGTAILVLATRDGLTLTPDGWAYWEASVSLLEGCGYRYIDGPEIRDWPPAFPVFLAGVQAIGGASVSSLAVGIALLYAVSIAGWSVLAARLPLDRGARNLAVVFSALFLVPWYAVVLSETLVLALLPWLLLTIVDAGERGEIAGPRAVAVAAILAIVALARHASLAFVVASAAAVLVVGAGRPRVRVALMLSVPSTAWAVWAAAAGDSARVERDAGLAIIGVRIRQAIEGIGIVFATSRWSLDVASSIGFLAAMIGLRGLDPRARRLACALLAFAAAAAMSLVVMTSLAPVSDALGGRFLMFLGPMGAMLLAILSSRGRSRLGRAFSIALLAALAMVQAARAGVVVVEGHAAAWGSVVPKDGTLTARAPQGGRERSGVRPPDFPWIPRERGTACR